MNQSRRSRDERAAFRTAAAERMKLYPTTAEKKLWTVLAVLGFKRQVSVESWRYSNRGYVLDFYHEASAVCVEVDGGYHGRTRGRDGRRDRDLRMLGIETIRLKNSDVIGKSPDFIGALLLLGLGTIAARRGVEIG